VRDGIRELDEELGLQVEFEDLISLGRRVDVKKSNELVDYQICHVFFYECHRPLTEYEYQADEIAGLLKMPIVEGLKLFAGELDALTVDAVGLGSDRVRVQVADFIKNVDQYAYKALILARRYFDGESDLLI
jgi:ADP-ribose pyrophosphatase YjhB (NUDIX family)